MHSNVDRSLRRNGDGEGIRTQVFGGLAQFSVRLVESFGRFIPRFESGPIKYRNEAKLRLQNRMLWST